MTLDIVEQIVAQRQSDPAQQDPAYRYETWLLSKGIVTLDQMKSLIPFVWPGGAFTGPRWWAISTARGPPSGSRRSFMLEPNLPG